MRFLALILSGLMAALVFTGAATLVASVADIKWGIGAGVIAVVVFLVRDHVGEEMVRDEERMLN